MPLGGLIVVLCCGALGACTTQEPLRVALVPLGQDRRSAAAPTELPCDLRTVEVTDERAEAQSLGQLATHPLVGQEVAPWVLAGLGLLRCCGANGREQDGIRDPVDLELVIKKFYVQTQRSSKTASIVLAVRLRNDRGDHFDKSYRGSDTSVFWTMSTEAVQKSFGKALGSLRAEISHDISTFCSRSLP